MAVPLAVGKNAVTGNARRVLHNGKALTAQLVEQVDLPTLGRPTTATIGLLIGVPPFLQPSQAQLTPRQLPRKGSFITSAEDA